MTIKYEIIDEAGKVIDSGQTDIRNIGYITQVLKENPCSIFITNFQQDSEYNVSSIVGEINNVSK